MNLKLLLPTYRARAQFVIATIRGLAACGPDGGLPRVLDVGCGEADLHAALRPRTAVLAGCDVNAGDIASAAAAYPGAAAGYRVADAARLPWENGAFDVVLCLEAIEHVADVGAALAQAARVLRPGGTLVLTCPNANFPITYDPLHWLVGRRVFPVGAFAYGHTWLPSEVEVRGALREAAFVGIEVTGLTGSLAAGAEAYWAGLAQRFVKRNAGNAGDGRTRGSAPAGAQLGGNCSGRPLCRPISDGEGAPAPTLPPTVSLAFIARKS